MTLPNLLDEFRCAIRAVDYAQLTLVNCRTHPTYIKMKSIEQELCERDKVLVDVVKNVASLGMNNAYYALVQDARWALEKIGEANDE